MTNKITLEDIELQRKDLSAKEIEIVLQLEMEPYTLTDRCKSIINDYLLEKESTITIFEKLERLIKNWGTAKTAQYLRVNRRNYDRQNLADAVILDNLGDFLDLIDFKKTNKGEQND